MLILYHLHVHGKYLPNFKKLCTSQRSAQTIFYRLVHEHFNFDIVKDLLRAPAHHHQDAYDWILDTGHTITSIDTQKCPKYQKLYLEHGIKPSDNLLEEMVENRNKFGVIEPFIRVKGD